MESIAPSRSHRTLQAATDIMHPLQATPSPALLHGEFQERSLGFITQIMWVSWRNGRKSGRPGLQRAIQNRDADGGFGLLTCKGPCPKLRANNPFVSTHRGFRERAAAIAGRLLPFQSPFGLDQGDMAITL